MNLSTLQYLSDQQGHTTGIVVPIDLWRNIQKLLGNSANKLAQSDVMPMSQETQIQRRPLREFVGVLKNSSAFNSDPIALQRAMRDEWD